MLPGGLPAHGNLRAVPGVADTIGRPDDAGTVHGHRIEGSLQPTCPWNLPSGPPRARFCLPGSGVHSQTSLLTPPVASLLALETEVAPRSTPKTAHGTAPKNTRVHHVHVLRSDLARIRQAGHAEVACRPPGWTAMSMITTPSEWRGIAP